jgi:hypothetical protein
VRQTAPAQSRRKRKVVRSKWQAFCLWVSLGFYRFTRSVKNVFKWEPFSTVSISLSTFQFCAHPCLIKLCQLLPAHDICSQHLSIRYPPGSKHSILSVVLQSTYLPFRRALVTCIWHLLPSTSSFVLKTSSSIPHHRISSPDDGKRAHAFHSIYIVLHSANIVIQYIGWGFHIGFGLGIVYIRYVSISSSAGLQITRHIVHAFLEWTIAPSFQ